MSTRTYPIAMIIFIWHSLYIHNHTQTPRDTKLACNAQSSIGICKKLRKKQIFGWFERGLWNQNIPLHVVEMSHKTKHIHDRDSSYVSVRYFFCLHHTVTHTQTLKKKRGKKSIFLFDYFFLFHDVYYILVMWGDLSKHLWGTFHTCMPSNSGFF